MKLKNIFFLLLCMTCSLGFVSCDDDDDNPSVHTNAAPLVVGTYTGDLVDEKGNQQATDVKITLSLVRGEIDYSTYLNQIGFSHAMTKEFFREIIEGGEKDEYIERCEKIINNHSRYSTVILNFVEER